MSDRPPPSSAKFLEHWLLPTGVVAAILIGIVGLGRFLRLDEANSVIIASSSVGRTVEYLRNDNNLPLYYLLLHGWIRLAGIGEWAVHLPSVIFYLLAVATTYQLGWEISRSRYGALYSAFFYLVSLQAIHQSQKARMYSLLGLLAGLSTLLFMRILLRDETRRRDQALYVMVNAIGTFVHVWYFFLLLGHAACQLTLQRKRFWSWAAVMGTSLLPFVFLWARYLPHQARIGAVDWMPQAQLTFFVSVFAEFFGGMKWGSAFLFLVIIICLLGSIRAEKGPENGEETDALPLRGVAALAIIVLACTLFPLLVSFFRPIYWPGRYTMIALPAFATILGCALAAWGSPKLRAAFAYCVLLGVIAFHVRTRTEVFETSSNVFQEQNSDKAATLQLCRNARPGDTLVFTGLSRAGVEYYLRRLKCGQGLDLISFPYDTAEHLGWVKQTDPGELQTEAEAIVQEFTRENPDGHKLWVTTSRKKTASQDLLAGALSRNLDSQVVNGLSGSFFDQVMVFTARKTTRTGTQGIRWMAAKMLASGASPSQ